MAIEDAIYTRVIGHASITALAAELYRDEAPETAALPYIVFTRVSTPRVECLVGYTSGLASPHFQFDCYAASPVTSRSMARALYDTLAGFSGTVAGESINFIRYINERSFPVPPEYGGEDVTYREVCEFEVWHGEAVPTL